jgi:hypothetical protein
MWHKAYLCIPSMFKVFYLATLPAAMAVQCQSIWVNVNMEHWWNVTDMEKQSQCHFVHHKSHMDRYGLKPGLQWYEAGD